MTLPEIYVTRRIPSKGLEMLDGKVEYEVWEKEAPPPHEVIVEKARGKDGIVTLLSDPIDREVIDAALPEVKVIAQYAVGVDNIDVAYATERGVLVTNTPGVLTDATADLAWALILAAARRIVESDKFCRSGSWSGWGPKLLRGTELPGKTLGIVGLGDIGQAVARRAAGFDMKVLYFSRTRRPELEKEHGWEYGELDQVISRSDVLSLHTPLTPETKGMIGARELDSMKETAVLVNTSRGPVVDQAALFRTLKEGGIRAAGLDVFETEPVPESEPLLKLDNVVVLPHIGSATYEARDAMAVMACENLLAALEGKRPAQLVNPGALNE